MGGEVFLFSICSPGRDSVCSLPHLSPCAINRHAKHGASPRGPISLVSAGRALAVIRGRDYVVPGDLEALVRDAFRHRLVLSYRALAEEMAPDAILDQVLGKAPVPQIDLGRSREVA